MAGECTLRFRTHGVAHQVEVDAASLTYAALIVCPDRDTDINLEAQAGHGPMRAEAIVALLVPMRHTGRTQMAMFKEWRKKSPKISAHCRGERSRHARK